MSETAITRFEDCQTLRDWRFWMLRKDQRQIAIAAGVDQSTVSAVENGRMTPRPARWDDWAAAYGLELAEFKRLLAGSMRQP